MSLPQDFRKKRLGAFRQYILRISRRVQIKLMSPSERLWDLIVDRPALTAALKTCLDVGLFQEWQNASWACMTYRDLGEVVKIEPETLRRLLRHLASHGAISEVGLDTYAPTKFTKALCTPSFRASMNYHFEVCGPLYLNLPSHLKSNNYCAPEDAKDGCFQVLKRCGGSTLFEYYDLPANREEADMFGIFLAAYRTERIPWIDIYDTRRIMDGYKGGPLLVDVGGNLGDDLDLFNQRHAGFSTDLYLEDLLGVVKRATCDPDIKRREHNFFETQPIESARAYYMHSILHDWNDSDVKTILKMVVKAMKPGYSRLLVNDIVLPSLAPTTLETSVDMQMMIMVSGKERTEDMFCTLFKEAGLQVDKVWRSRCSVTSIFECSVAQNIPDL